MQLTFYYLYLTFEHVKGLDLTTTQNSFGLHFIIMVQILWTSLKSRIAAKHYKLTYTILIYKITQDSFNTVSQKKKEKKKRI